MTNPVMAALANARAQEQAAQAAIAAQQARHDAAVLTAAVAEKLGVVLTTGTVDRAAWSEWAAWCQAQRVEAHPPVLPCVVATFILNQATLGIEKLTRIVDSISAVHAPGADPTLSPLVAAALNSVAPIEPPHSFPKEQKAMFTQLPRPLQKFVAEHTRKIVTEMRRAQNAAAITKREKSNGTTTKQVSTAATAHKAPDAHGTR